MADSLFFQQCGLENEPLICPVDFVGNNIVFREAEHDHVVNAQVEFTNLYPGKKFYKRQCRKNYKGHKARQVVDNGLVYGTAKYGGEQLLTIRGWVRREPEAAELYADKNGEVLVCGTNNEELNLIKENDMPKFTKDGHTLQSFSVDLGDIYEGPFQPVFELSRGNMERLNKFQLVVQLVFLDGQTSGKFVSPAFICCTKKRKAEQDETTDESGKRKARDDRGESSVLGNSSSLSESGGLDSPQRHKQILVEILDAKTANIKDLVCDTMSTSKADVAYHLRLKNPLLNGELEEGDIVGFYKDNDTSEVYIQKLRSDNIHDALHAGVISRSYWIEGNKPLNPGETDTVCVIGIVPVKVIGAIENGERIYASRDHPGKAIPQSHMPVGSFLRKKHVLLGMAIEGKKSTRNPTEVNLVKCFVCIVLDVSRQELLEEIEDLYEVIEIRTEAQIKIHTRKTWRKIKCCSGTVLVVLAAIIFLMYQWLAPGSLFRYWLCRRGCIPDHHLYFEFLDVNNRTVRVHGIAFTKTALQEKVGVKFDENHVLPNGTARYYLNIDRCAYYYVDGAAGNNIGGHKYIGGGRILSIFDDDNTVYECREMEKNSWDEMKYQKNVRCVPPRTR